MGNQFSLSNPKEKHHISVNNIRDTNIDENEFIGKGFTNLKRLLLNNLKDQKD